MRYQSHEGSRSAAERSMMTLVILVMPRRPTASPVQNASGDTVDAGTMNGSPHRSFFGAETTPRRTRRERWERRVIRRNRRDVRSRELQGSTSDIAAAPRSAAANSFDTEARR